MRPGTLCEVNFEGCKVEGFFIYETPDYIVIERNHHSRQPMKLEKDTILFVKVLEQPSLRQHQLAELARYLRPEHPIWDLQIVFVGPPDDHGLGTAWVKDPDGICRGFTYDVKTTVPVDFSKLRIGDEYLVTIKYPKDTRTTRMVYLGKETDSDDEDVSIWDNGRSRDSYLAEKILGAWLVEESRDLNQYLPKELWPQTQNTTLVYVAERWDKNRYVCYFRTEGQSSINWDINHKEVFLKRLDGEFWGDVLCPKAHRLQVGDQFVSPNCPFPVFVSEIEDGLVHITALPDEGWQVVGKVSGSPCVISPGGSRIEDFDLSKNERMYYEQAFADRFHRYEDDVCCGKIKYLKEFPEKRIEMLVHYPISEILRKQTFFRKECCIKEGNCLSYRTIEGRLLIFGDIIQTLPKNGARTTGRFLNIESNTLLYLNKEEKLRMISLDHLAEVSIVQGMRFTGKIETTDATYSYNLSSETCQYALGIAWKIPIVEPFEQTI